MRELQNTHNAVPYGFSLLKEGKTKRVWHCDDNDIVIIENTDRLTAYNGLKETTIPQKGWYATQISNICFRYLHYNQVPNHYLWVGSEKEQQHMFWARKLTMLPLEFVVRFQPYGSYLDRHPDVSCFDSFPEPVVEIFEKYDDLGDPYVHIDYERETVSRFLPDLPPSKISFIDEQPFCDLGHLMIDQWGKATQCVLDAATELRNTWHQGGATLVDIKFECGIDSQGSMLIGDAIDSDCWRLWRGGDPDDPLDRQLFKNNCQPFEIIEAQKFILKQTMQWLPADGGNTGN